MKVEKLSTSIDELRKSGLTVLKPMKLISYELDRAVVICRFVV